MTAPGADYPGYSGTVPGTSGGAHAAAPAGTHAAASTATHSAASTAAAGTQHDIADVPLGQLISDITQDMSTLLRQEVALAKAEVTTEVTKTGKAAGMFGGAGFAGYMVLLFLSIAAWWGLSNVMDQGWAALIVAAIWAVIGFVLYSTGRTQFRRVHPKPERTVETVSQIPDALKGR